MKTNLTVFQTEAYLKAFNVPNNCSIPISEKLFIPAFCKDGILKIYMQLLDESLIDNSKILELMREFNVKKIFLNSCYTDNINDSGKRRIVYPENSNTFCYLPESIESYMSKLGKSSREHIRSYERKFFSTYNSVKCFTQYSNEVNKNDFMEIIRLNRERCLLKGFKSGCDELYAERLFELITSYGTVTYLKLENKIIAGVILTKVKNEACLQVISHDNSYSNCHIGYVILKKAIEQSIKDNINVFNFLWGDFQYKFQFGGEKKTLNDVIYFKYFTDYYLAIFVDQSITARKALLGFIKKLLRPYYHFARRTFKWLINNSFLYHKS